MPRMRLPILGYRSRRMTENPIPVSLRLPPSRVRWLRRWTRLVPENRGEPKRRDCLSKQFKAFSSQVGAERGVSGNVYLVWRNL